MNFYFTQDSVLFENITLLFDSRSYKEIGRVEIIENNNYKGIISIGRNKGKYFTSWNKDICEAWIGSNFYHKKR